MLCDHETELIETCVNQLKSWKSLIAKYLDEDERAVEMDKLRSVVEGIAEVDIQFKKNQNTFVKIDEYLDEHSDPGNVDVDKLFNEFYNNQPSSSEANITNSHVWKEVIQDEDEIVFVEKKVKKLNDNNFDTVDDSLLCSNVFTPPVDPISKAIIKNPYRNKRCNHVYEYDTITIYINQLRHRAKCPYIGCSNKNLKMSDLREDNDLQMTITQYLDEHEGSQSSSEE